MALPAQAQGFDLATATKWTSELLSDFCDTADFNLGFVPDAALLFPPAQNVYVDHRELANPPQSNADALLGDAERETADVKAALLRRFPALSFGSFPPWSHPESDPARQAEAWGCSGADGAELCANLENLFNL